MERLPFLVATPAVVVVLLTGCVPTSSGCPSIGWLNELTVHLEGDTAVVADLLICIDDSCAPGLPDDLPDELAVIAWNSPARTGDDWHLTTGMTSPTQFTIRLLDASGAVLTETEVAAEWIRVGGTAECGGPEHSMVTLRV